MDGTSYLSPLLIFLHYSYLDINSKRRRFPFVSYTNIYFLKRCTIFFLQYRRCFIYFECSFCLSCLILTAKCTCRLFALTGLFRVVFGVYVKVTRYPQSSSNKLLFEAKAVVMKKTKRSNLHEDSSRLPL